MKIVVAGGTILKDYDLKTGMMPLNKNGLANLKMVLEEMLLENVPEIHVWGMKDSLQMTMEDRESLYDYCKELKDERIVLIHGTDTMQDSHEYFRIRALSEETPKLSQYLHTFVKGPFATIVFTGAFYPLCIRGTEAEFNLGFSIGCAKTLPKGIYVAMHGEVFCKDVKKNFETSTFEGKTL